MTHSQKSQKFVPTSLTEVAAAAREQRVPQKKHGQTAAERRAAAKKSTSGAVSHVEYEVFRLKERFNLV